MAMNMRTLLLAGLSTLVGNYTVLAQGEFPVFAQVGYSSTAQCEPAACGGCEDSSCSSCATSAPCLCGQSDCGHCGHGACGYPLQDLWAHYCAEHRCHYAPVVCSYDCCPPLWSARGSALWLKKEGDATDTAPAIGNPGLGTMAYDPDYEVGYEIEFSRAIGPSGELAIRWFDVDWSNSVNRTVGVTTGQFSNDVKLRSFDLVYESCWSTYFKPSVGFRYVNYDAFRRTAVSSVTPLNFVSTDIDNAMYGFQMGVEGSLWDGKVWSLDYSVNGAILYNDVNTAIGFDAGAGTVLRNDSRNGEAFLGEAEIRSRIHIMRHIALVSAYRCIWIDGISDSSGITAASAASTTMSRDSAFFQGFDVGVELLW